MNKILPIVGVIGEISNPSPTSAFQDFKRQGCVDTYTTAIEKNNAISLIIPYVKDFTKITIYSYINKIDALLIPGGYDVNPQLYNEDKKEECKPGDINFDKFSIELIKEAFNQKKPILGICRGCQLLNVAFGGSLYQDQKYDNRDEKVYNHFDLKNIDTPSHQIIINKNSLLNSIFKKQVIDVNSLHHQSINQVGNSLNLCALSIDGSVEGIEYFDPSYFCIGVQWHPETLLSKTDTMKPLFSAFINSI